MRGRRRRRAACPGSRDYRNQFGCRDLLARHSHCSHERVRRPSEYSLGYARHVNQIEAWTTKMKVGQSAGFDITALYAAIDTQRQLRAMSWQEVAREINGSSRSASPRRLSPSTLTGLRRRRAVEGDGVLQMLRWLHRTPESFVPGCHEATSRGAALPEVGPHRVLRFDTRAIFAALDTERTRKRLTWKEVAEQIGGLRPANLTRLSKGGRTAFPQVMRIIGWLGRTAASFTRTSSW